MMESSMKAAVFVVYVAHSVGIAWMCVGCVSSNNFVIEDVSGNCTTAQTALQFHRHGTFKGVTTDNGRISSDPLSGSVKPKKTDRVRSVPDFG